MNKPEIKRVAAKIATLERRAEHLSSQLENNEGSAASLGYVRAELKAIEAGIEALRWHRVSNDEMDSPIVALVELLESFEAAEVPFGNPAVDKARAVIQAWTQSIDQEVLASQNG